MFKIRGLRRKWFLSTIAAVSALGLACVLAITAVFAGYCYKTAEADLRNLSEMATAFFEGTASHSESEYYRNCAAYTSSFQNEKGIVLQFVDTDGKILAVSKSDGESITVTNEVAEAVNIRTNTFFSGRDPQTNMRIMAIACPMIYSSGEVMGVLRFATTMQSANYKILAVAGVSLILAVVVATVVMTSSNYYIRMISRSLADIVEKAKRITSGSYGIQITTKYYDEIGELADTINDMSIQINQNEKIQTEFISSLSHELRTPLTAITGWSETLLSSDTLDKETSRGIKIILGETRRLTEMVLELLDFTRIQDGRMTLNMELTDIRSAFEDTVYMYGSRLAQDGITLEYLESEEDIPEISCDPQRLRQVFLNILDNAAKHGSEGKRIEASLKCDNEVLLIQIRDFGPGIPEDEVPLVKKKFYKGSSKARGSGIGLAVCDEIVQMHGGVLTLENADGGGVLVTVQLPLKQ